MNEPMIEPAIANPHPSPPEGQPKTPTPGPWRIPPRGWRKNPDNPTLVIGSDHRDVAEVRLQTDARLIATAPELLALLEEVLAYGLRDPLTGTAMSIEQRARTVIAKARGEAIEIDDVKEGERA